MCRLLTTAQSRQLLPAPIRSNIDPRGGHEPDRTKQARPPDQLGTRSHLACHGSARAAPSPYEQLFNSGSTPCRTDSTRRQKNDGRRGATRPYIRAPSPSLTAVGARDQLAQSSPGANPHLPSCPILGDRLSVGRSNRPLCHQQRPSRTLRKENAATNVVTDAVYPPLPTWGIPTRLHLLTRDAKEEVFDEAQWLQTLS
jgi:hypothetical protein